MKECQLCKTCFADDVASCPNDGMPTVHTLAGAPVLEGKYHLESRLGQGGMGIVYKARHAYLKTTLAIKVILPDLVGNDPQLVTRFRQEALAAAAIRHQNVVSVTDYGVIDGSVPFLVMEYVEGESLHDLLAREKSLSPDKAFDLISAVCAGVGAAHHQGIVHRDLKPLNVMICSDKPNLSSAVKILDFGLAKIKSGELLGSFIQAQTTGLMGSPYYMAPEQWADEEPDSRADIYSLGVMLFQMLAGDVPFKGSSIPAIMKKHISDPLPTLASAGVSVSPELERAVLHTLQKDPEKRTASVEQFVEELRQAIRPGAPFINTGQTLPVSTLTIISKPPKSSVYIDSISVGQTRDDGALLLEGIQSGNHHLRISHKGFYDWQSEVVCDGKPQEVVAELQAGVTDSNIAIPKPGRESAASGAATMVNRGGNAGGEAMSRTMQQNWQPGEVAVSVGKQPQKKSGFSPAVLGMIGLLALLLIGGIGLGGAYMLGFFGSKSVKPANVNASVNANTQTATTPESVKQELIQISGGTYTMGRNVEPYEYGEHPVQVSSFWIGRTEVTNAQYLEFVTASGHVPPKNWSDKKPLPNTEQRPVAFVSYDDAIAYCKWRSQKDGGTFRLPTEQEWEYVARNGAKGNLFPWGNNFVDGNAVMGKEDSEPVNVDTKPQGANSWGVVDLIGNVWEWTSTQYHLYPGSESKIPFDAKAKGNIMIRGGSADEKPNEKPPKTTITSTYRNQVPRDTKNKVLGFRIVKEG